MESNWFTSALPFELGMALVENPAALEKYAALSRREKEQFVAGAGHSGRSQMQQYVQHFMDGFGQNPTV